MAKKRIGRPPVHPSRKRSAVLKVLLTPSEHAALERSATTQRLDVSSFVRQQLAPALSAATP